MQPYLSKCQHHGQTHCSKGLRQVPRAVGSALLVPPLVRSNAVGLKGQACLCLLAFRVVRWLFAIYTRTWSSAQRASWQLFARSSKLSGFQQLCPTQVQLIIRPYHLCRTDSSSGKRLLQHQPLWACRHRWCNGSKLLYVFGATASYDCASRLEQGPGYGCHDFASLSFYECNSGHRSALGYQVLAMDRSNGVSARCS